MRNAFLLALAGFAVGMFASGSDRALGRDQFKKAFDKKYVKSEPATDAEKALAEAVAKAKCNICHIGATPGKNRNDYGKAYNQFAKTKDATNAEKLSAAFDEVAKVKSNPNDPNSPTFGELIAQGKLPCENPPTGTAAAPTK